MFSGLTRKEPRKQEKSEGASEPTRDNALLESSRLFQCLQLTRKATGQFDIAFSSIASLLQNIISFAGIKREERLVD